MVTRSEEHTSELQSRFDLVCRLHLPILFPYTTLFRSLAAEVLTHQNLISQNIILEFDCYPGIEYRDTNIPLVIHGWNEAKNIGYKTDANHYLMIKCINGHQIGRAHV